MFSVRSWMKNSKGDALVASQVLPSEEQLEDALYCLNYVMDDDVLRAEAELANGTSCYHVLGKALIMILKGTLDLEEDIAHNSSGLMVAAESLSASNYAQCQRERAVTKSAIYPPGSEFALCNAQAKISLAVLALMNQSLTECIKAFYKLRKAYMTLETIIAAENAFLENMSKTSSSPPMALKSNLKVLHKVPSDKELENSPSDEAIERQARNQEALIMLNSSRGNGVFASGADIYVHSGANFCFGLILLGLSLVPSIFRQPLKIIGFRGDKEAGMKMLWQATKVSNIQGALAALVLLAYYNASRVICDILDVEAYPKKRCEDLVNQMTAKYPNSRLWMLEQARIAVSNCELQQAIEILTPPTRSKMKQLEALNLLEKSLYAAFLHDYAMCADGFIASVPVNKFSKAFYYYAAGAAQVELYRKTSPSQAGLAATYKDRAEDWLKQASKLVDQKGLLSQQLPFDAFVDRKIKKWQKRAEDRKIHFVDAIGVSPIEEIVYVYGGYKRMKKPQLDDSLSALAWSEKSPRWKDESLDEKAIHTLLISVVHRTLGNVEKARKLLMKEILAHDRQAFKGKLSDNWVCPCAHYEMAIVCWMERKQDPSKAVAKCLHYLDEVSRWERFDLDSRIALKVSVTREVLKDYKVTPALE